MPPRNFRTPPVIPLEVPVTPSFFNGWTNHASAAASYRKNPFGEVRLTGALAGGTLSTAAFFLPGGYRPAADLAFATSGPSASSPCRVVVRTTGAVEIQAAANNYVALDGVVFAAA